MVTVNSDIDFDDIVSPSPGPSEAIIVNSNAVLTINTDTRWHKNAPAGIDWGKGTLGNITLTSATGGKVVIDAQNVRWIPFTSGSGNVPTLGSTITGSTSGAQGDLLGVYGSLNAPPIQSGNAMPSSGFLKFKSVVDGPFNAAESLSGISATTNGDEKVGWIEVAMDDLRSISCARSCAFETMGDWFGIGTTNGAAGQIFQCPNPGGENTRIAGVWIETDVGSDEYEFWPAQTGTSWTTSCKGTDDRNKFVEMLVDGQIRIGSNGTNNLGYVPASGLKVRIPNILLMSARSVSGTYAWANNQITFSFTNHYYQVGEVVYVEFATGDAVGNNGYFTITSIPDANTFVFSLTGAGTGGNAATSLRINTLPKVSLANRPDFTTTSAGNIKIANTIGHWYGLFAQACTVEITNSAFLDAISITECATKIILSDVHSGNLLNSDVSALTLTSNFAGGEITDCKFGRGNVAANSDYGISFTYCIGFIFTRCHFQLRSFRTGTTGYAFYGAYCSNISLIDCVVVGNSVYFVASLDLLIKSTKYADNFHTTSQGSPAVNGVVYIAAGCVNSKIDGIDWHTSVENVHPDQALVYIQGATNTRVQNIGTRAVPLSGGSTNIMLYAIRDGGNNYNVEIKRVYCCDIATRFYNGINSSKLIIIENCAAEYTTTMGTSGTAGFVVLEGYVKNLASSAAYNAYTSVYGTIFYNLFTSNTQGRIGLMFNEPTENQNSISYSFTGASGFTSTGRLTLLELNDYCIYEFPYWIYGINAFQNSNVVLGGVNTGNHTIEYQIDTGDGWNGTWKSATGSNLNAEPISATNGFRLKLRITCNTANSGNYLNALYILTSADEDAQDVQYPLDTYTLSLAGLQTGSKVAFIQVNSETLLTDVVTENSGEVVFSYPDTLVDTPIDIAILAPNYYYQRIEGYSLKAENVQIPIVQKIDSGYDDQVPATITFDGANKRIICDEGTLELSVIGLYSKWVLWALTENNLRFKPAFLAIGGDIIDIAAGTKIPVFAFLINEWRIKPQEANHTLVTNGGILLVNGGGDPFVDTDGSYVVRINYQQPIQAISIDGGGGAAGDATLSNQNTMISLLNLLKKMVDDGQALSIALR